MDKTTFQNEDKKYSELWQDGYKDANWKRLAMILLKEVPNHEKSLIDFGMGRGTALDFFEQKGFYVEGVDISSYAVGVQLKKGRKVYHTSLDNLSIFRENQFNLGFCNDVIEHLPINLVHKSLEEMSRVCSEKLFISVCPTASNHLSLEGENLHLTIKPQEWWDEEFKKYGQVQRVKFLFSRSLRYIINQS